MRSQYLFAQVDMFNVIDYQKQQATKGVQQIDSAHLQRATEAELVSRIVDKYRIDVPVIQDDKIYVADHGEAQVDVRGDFNRAISDRSRPFNVPGTKTTIAIPFVGDAELFKVQPNSYTTTRPTGEIVGRELRLTYEQAEPNSEAIKNACTKTVQEVKQYLDWQRSSADEFNRELEGLVRQRISERKQKLSMGAGMIESLGLPTVKPE